MPNSEPPCPAQFREQMVELSGAGPGLKQLSREFGVSANAIPIGMQRDDGDMSTTGNRPLEGNAVAVANAAGFDGVYS